MHQSWQLRAALCLHRHDEAPAALRDERVLQNVAVARGGNDALQDLAASGRRRALVAANFRELGRGRVGDLVFVEDRGRDLLLQKAVRVQGEEELVDDRALLVLPVIVLHAPHIGEQPRDVEKLPRVEHAAALGARERLAHIAHAAESGTAAQQDHLARRVGLVEQAVYLAEVVRRRQTARPRLGFRAHSVTLEHFQKARQLQHADGFFKQFTHSFLRNFDSDSYFFRQIIRLVDRFHAFVEVQRLKSPVELYLRKNLAGGGKALFRLAREGK